MLRRAVRQRHATVSADFTKAFGHHQAGRLDEAEALYRRVLAEDGRHADSLYLLGVLASQTQRLELSNALIGKAIKINARKASYHSDLGHTLRALGQLEEAAESYRQAAKLEPEAAYTHSNLGTALQEQGRLDEALICYRKAIHLDPTLFQAHSNIGNTLTAQGHLDEAVTCYRRAIALKPDFTDAHSNLGTAFQEQGHLDEAVTCYRSAIAHDPGFPDAHFNLAMALLARGDMAEGWTEYEWRWKTPLMSKSVRNFPQPQWRGEAAEGRTLLIHAEQGFGDTIQFCRYAPLAAATGLRVMIEAPKPLVRLLRGLPGVDSVVAKGDDLPPFDLHCPMLSLPLALGTTLATIPGAAAYLHADAAQVAAWRTRLAAMPSQGLRVGLVWAGSATLKTDRRRSIALTQLAPLFDLPGLQFFSLQKGEPAEPKDPRLNDVMSEMDDFADTAALIANLDLVIAVDTAVAHLAAALGKPVWMLDRFCPDWRWLLGRRDSPWYPALRIYRQAHPGDWSPVLTEVANDLRTLAATGPHERHQGSLAG